jgi:hypothetical protein
LGLPEIPKCSIVTTVFTAADLLFSQKMCKWKGKIEIGGKVNLGPRFNKFIPFLNFKRKIVAECIIKDNNKIQMVI